VIPVKFLHLFLLTNLYHNVSDGQTDRQTVQTIPTTVELSTAYQSPENQQRVFTGQLATSNVSITHFIFDRLAGSRATQCCHYMMRYDVHLQTKQETRLSLRTADQWQITLEVK